MRKSKNKIKIKKQNVGGWQSDSSDRGPAYQA
jgi:hypothetical protein